MIGRTFKAMGVSTLALAALAAAALAQTTAPSPTPAAPPAAAAPAQPPATAAPAPQGKGMGKGEMSACHGDMQTLCGTVAPKGGGRMRCLVENKAKASAECQAVIANVEQRMTERKAAGKDARKQVRDACQADVKSVCAAAPKGRGGMIQCLRENQAKVSPDCAKAIAAMPAGKGSGAGKAQ